MDDVFWVSGRPYSYSRREEDHADRDLVLRGPILFRAPAHDHAVVLDNVQFMGLSARHIVHLAVSPLRWATAAGAPVAPRTGATTQAAPTSTAGAASADAPFSRPGGSRR
jgi:hypothetical protein